MQVSRAGKHGFKDPQIRSGTPRSSQSFCWQRFSATAPTRGFDVLSIREAGRGISDDAVLDAANSDDRILITEDQDFGEMVIRQRLRVRGVVLLELDRLSNAMELALSPRLSPPKRANCWAIWL